MSLTRKGLKAMGLSDEQVDTIAEEHGNRVGELKAEIEDLKEKVKNFDTVKKELDEAKSGDYKKKYEDKCKELDDFKASVKAESEKTAKEAAVKAYFESKNITGKNLEIAMRGSRDEIASLKLKDGKIEDTAALDELVGGTFAGLVVETQTKGANVAKPPAGTGAKAKPTKEEILKIEDDTERQKAIAANIELFD